MGYITDNCGMANILVNHLPPLEPGRYAEAQVRSADGRIERFYEKRKNNPSIKDSPEVANAYALRIGLSRTCEACQSRPLSFCRADNGFNSVYPVVIFSSVGRYERRHAARIFRRGVRSEDEFVRQLGEEREAYMEECAGLALKKAKDFGIYDNGDFSEHYNAIEIAKSRHPCLEYIFSWLKGFVVPSRDRLKQHISADVRALSEELLSEDETRLRYRGMTGEVPLESCREVFERIEAWLPSVKAFKEHSASGASLPHGKAAVHEREM